MRSLSLATAVLLLCLTPFSALAEEDPKVSWQRLTGILQYLESDYPLALETQSEFEIEEQRLFIADAIEIAESLGEDGEIVLPRLRTLQERILAQADPQLVSPICGELIEEILTFADLDSSPAMTPDLQEGKKLYGVYCASCHGVDGKADVPLAEEMEPPPTDFTDEDMATLTPFKAFNTIRFGIGGTAMVGFPQLSEEERWALAFYLPTLRLPDCDGEPPAVSLEELATSTDEDLIARHGEDQLACLRQKLPVVDSEDLLTEARAAVREAMELAAAGQVDASRRMLLDAYLGYIEPLEPRLRARHASLVDRIEGQFLTLRAAVERGGDVAQEGERLLLLIDQAAEATETTGFAVFWVAFVIILREGFEAMIVVGALLAVLKRMDQRQHARVVHAGWVSALLIGAVGFLFARHLLLGANREWLEGIAALVAVVMLVYHTMWMSARANVAVYMQELRGQMESALGKGSVFGLFTVAFVAVLRESFEVVLFLQGLSIDSPSGVLWGAVVGLVALLALILLVYRVGFKLPMRFLFQASSVLLFATAVLLLGKGLRAFQEVGAIPLYPIPFVSVPALGIFPDGYTLFPQIALALSPFVWMKLRRKKKPATPSAAPSGEV